MGCKKKGYETGGYVEKPLTKPKEEKRKKKRPEGYRPGDIKAPRHKSGKASQGTFTGSP